jgi:hypothetical protein
LWRLIGAANPGSIKFASSHPTTAERFVRLDNWRNEISQKIALGKTLQPEMKNGKTFIVEGSADRAVASNKMSAGSSIATLSPATRSAKEEKKVAVPERRPLETESISPTVSKTTDKSAKPVSETNAVERTAHAIIGAPSSDSARIAATEKFEDAQKYFGTHDWKRAEAAFRETLLLDGSLAKYHAALAKLMMVLRRYDEAVAEYTAATLIDLDNAEYRKLLKEARSKR